MNSVIEAMIQRRSIKQYTGEQVTDEELEQILQCGLYAPNGMGAQAPVFVAVRDSCRRTKKHRSGGREPCSWQYVSGCTLFGSGVMLDTQVQTGV